MKLFPVPCPAQGYDVFQLSLDVQGFPHGRLLVFTDKHQSKKQGGFPEQVHGQGVVQLLQGITEQVEDIVGAGPFGKGGNVCQVPMVHTHESFGHQREADHLRGPG